MSGRSWLLWSARLLPCLILLLLLGFGSIWQGLLLCFNCLITNWNRLHQGGIALFPTAATAQSLMSISILTAVFLGEVIQYAAERRRLLFCGILGGLLLLLQLLDGTLSLWACALYLSGLLGLWFTAASAPSRQAVRLWLLCTAVLCLCAFVSSRTELDYVTNARHDAAREIHTLRYGEDLLPEGHLDRAAALHSGDGELLKIYTTQEKSIYLRGFIGADYQDGVWTSPADAAYGGDYAGMMRWLNEQGFDPLTQVADYYTLSDPDDSPEGNQLTVEVPGAARCYIYAPAGTDAASAARFAEKKDLRFAPRGFFGQNKYTLEEYSSSKPAELTIRADWVENPETEAQARYAQAEAVYRNFVYQTYTQVDTQLEPLIQFLFWTDNVPETGSVYSALDHIRTVLKTTVPALPDGLALAADPISEFLTGTREGNSMLYASAAVQALRSHGLPARYVEGYYLSAESSAAGTVSLTRQDAHAWAEVYFDGVGWLPVDVTPGYYYDAVTLRQMVLLPDTIRKTAALDDSPDGADPLTGSEEASKPFPSPTELARNTVLLLLGFVSLLVLLLTFFLILLELLRLIVERHAYAVYHAAAPGKRVELLQKRLFSLLSLWGIDACLGWNTAQTDAALSSRFADITPGDYVRVASLLEKSLYGGIELEPFELRAIHALRDKLTIVPVSTPHQMYWKLRYSRLIALFSEWQLTSALSHRKISEN